MGATITGGRTAALVLAGAAVKAAFEAGALEVIASRGVAVRRIVAASSGALNGAAYAASVRARREVQAARELCRVWEDDASLCSALHPSFRAVLARRGLSDPQKLLAMFRRHVRPSRAPDPAPIELHIMLAPLEGRQGHADGQPATTYSQILSFQGASFDAPDTLERVFVAAAASAALPALFEPVDVPGVGPCVDGGLVNHTPILAALGSDLAEPLDAVLVVTPMPAVFVAPPEEYHGMKLLVHELDMVFAEWVYQDLRRATQLNEGLARLDALALRKGWGPDDVREIQAALGLERARRVPIVPIRPVNALPGTMLSGLTDPAMRHAYVRIGRECATQVLDQIGWR